MRSSLSLYAFLCAVPLAACTPSDDDDDADDGGVGDDDSGPEVPDDNVACNDDFCVITGTIVEDLHLTADVAWVLRGGVFVGNDTDPVTLSIDPGTRIFGEDSTDGMLVVRRGARLVADGTADAPIVFTSSQPVGSRAPGQWGGLILNGRAPINSCASAEEPAEGPCEAFGEGGTGWYGGDDPDDDSGVLRYVRVEFAGNLISPENELNGIAFQGVGRGTVVDYVQVHMNADDGIEFFGGTVEARHAVVTAPGDDGIDWTDGWQGKIQFAVVQQWPEMGDNGMEADNNADANDAEPRSRPTIRNVTLLGVSDSTSSDLGMLLREGTAGDISRVVVAGFNEACLDIDHDATFAQTDAGSLDIHDSFFECAVLAVDDEDDLVEVGPWLLGRPGVALDTAGITDAFSLATPDWTLAAGAAAGSLPASAQDAFFQSTTFAGGVGADNWTAGWTIHDAN